MRATRCLGFALALALSSGVGAAVAQSAGGRSVASPEVWQATLQGVDEDLRAGRWKAARRDADRVVANMLRYIRSGPDSARWLASAVALRALAEAGLGNADAAAWDWHVALSLRPDLTRFDLAPFGTAGQFFAGEEFRARTVPAPDDEAGWDQLLGATDPNSSTEGSGKTLPPRKIQGPRPQYPLAKRLGCVEEAIFVHVLIEPTGRLIAPRFTADVDPILAVAALEAVRKWRFEPGRLDGRPVPVHFHLRVNFDADDCD
jgi:hypothetical protein